MTKKLLSIIALLSLAVTNAWADANGYCGDPSVNEGKNVTWAYDNGTLTISGSGAMADFAGRDYQPWKDYRSSITSIVIENGVTGIGKSALSDCTGLTSIEIPASVTSIGNFAIEYCPKLASIEIPASVTSIGVQTFDGCTVLTAVTFASGSQLESIGKGAFHNCTSLTSIEIPASVTSIGNFAFYGCTGLTSITVASENAYYSSDDGVLFNKDKTTLIYYLEGKAADSYTIPSSVTSIGDNAFRYCSKLASLEIPASVTNIGNYTFFECTGLTSITVASENAYYSSDDNGVLFNKDKTTLIRYPAGKTADSYTIPDGVTSIDIHAFSNCYGLTSIAIPSIVTSIGELAFYKCTGLASVVVYAQSCSLGPRAFYECANLSKIYVPGDKVDEYKATENWSTYASKIEANITANGYCGDPSVNEGKNVTWTLTGTSPNYTLTISGTGEMANYVSADDQPWKDYRSSITSVVIENGVTSIGKSAFDGCISLATITLNSNPTIGEEAFKDIKNGATVTMNLTGNEGKTGEYWMTFYNQNYNFTADANTTVYKAAVSGSRVNLTEVDDIPKGNAAILKSSNAAITMTLTASATADYSGNELIGTDADTDASGMIYAYCLSKNSSGEVGFYKFTGNGVNEIIPANRAYLIINDGGSGSRSFYGIGDGDATAIENLKPAMVGDEGTIYDLSGRRVVGQPRKGIYVKNGKKIVIK